MRGERSDFFLILEDRVMRRVALFVLAVALAACELLGGAQLAHAGVTAIEVNVDGGGWISLASNAGSSVGPVSANLFGVFDLQSIGAIASPPTELSSSNLKLTNL